MWIVAKTPYGLTLERDHEPFMQEDAVLTFFDYSKAQAFADNLNRE